MIAVIYFLYKGTEKLISKPTATRIYSSGKLAPRCHTNDDDNDDNDDLLRERAASNKRVSQAGEEEDRQSARTRLF